MKAAITLQYSQADGFPCDLTFCSHFLQIAEVFPLLQIKKKEKKKLLDFFKILIKKLMVGVMGYQRLNQRFKPNFDQNFSEIG